MKNKILVACGRKVRPTKVFEHAMKCKVCSRIKWSVESVLSTKNTK
jgi:hypothetical protein